jgi:hypothetical protein
VPIEIIVWGPIELNATAHRPRRKKEQRIEKLHYAWAVPIWPSARVHTTQFDKWSSVRGAGGVGRGLTGCTCRPLAPLALWAEARERRRDVVVTALPAGRDAGGAVADEDRLPLQDEPVLEKPAVVGRRRRVRRLGPQHREVRVLALSSGADRRREVPVVAPGEVRVDGSTAV